MNCYLDVLKKYVVFRGRAQRKEFWYFVLFSFIITFVLGIIENVVGIVNSDAGLGLLSGLYSLAVLIPSIAVGVRRLHDTNRSGWWLLISLIPIIGAIVLIIFFVSASKPEEEQYGLVRKANAA